MVNTRLALASLEDGSPVVDSRQLAPIRPPVEVYLGGLAEATRERARARLDVIANLHRPGLDALSLAWWELDFADTAALRAAIESRWKWQTGNNYLHSLKGLLRTCWSMGLMPTDRYLRAVNFKKFRGARLPAGRHVGKEEWKQLFASIAADTSPLGLRDLALVGFLRTTAVRKTEALGVDLADYDPRALGFRVKGGKTGEERDVYAAEWLRGPLVRYLEARGPLPGALWVRGIPYGGLDPNLKRLSSEGLHHALRRRVEASGVPYFSAHSARRTFIGDLLNQGVDVLKVMRQVGHRQVETTKLYDLRPAEDQRHSAQLIDNPFA